VLQRSAPPVFAIDVDMWSALATAKDVRLQGGVNRIGDATSSGNTLVVHIGIATPYNFIT
jgi:hypothetical protein